MTTHDADQIAEFYDRHPYPPPLSDLGPYRTEWQDPIRRRVEHHHLWPTMPFRDDHSILVAGCGTSQAARYAIRYPDARVVGIDVSSAVIAHTRALADRHGLDNLRLLELPIERVGELGEAFDQIVCTGVLHHLADPAVGLRELRDALAPTGAMHLMVYAPYGRTGISMIQEYCRRLGVGASPDEIDDLVASLREIPMGHPLSHLLRDAPDFRDQDALADALLNPRERAYSVPQLFDLLAGAKLQFGRWVRQAPYLPRCGFVASIPHGARIAALDPIEQYAAVELFRGTMTRHSIVAYRNDRHTGRDPIRFDGEAWHDYIPLRPRTAVVVEQRLPPGVAAALLNRAHEHTDLVLFINEGERSTFRAIDGRRTIGELTDAGPAFFERLWEHDLIVIDASAGTQR